MKYRGGRQWSPGEIEAGLWVAMATETATGIEEVSKRGFVTFDFSKKLQPLVSTTTTVNIAERTRCELFAVATSPEGAPVEYCRNGLNAVEPGAFAVTVSWDSTWAWMAKK